jgi:hypothetical protein
MGSSIRQERARPQSLRLLNAEFGDTTSFNYDFDDAPGIWINNDKGGQTDAVTRSLEHQFAALTGSDPIVGATNQVMKAMADQTEQQFLHMVTSDPNQLRPVRQPGLLLHQFLPGTQDLYPSPAVELLRRDAQLRVDAEQANHLINAAEDLLRRTR